MGSLWKTLDRALLRDVALVCLAVGVIGLSYGAIAVASGFPLWLPVVLGLLVVAASSEFLFIGIIAAGGSPVAAVIAGLLVNARHLPFGLAVPDVLGRGAWWFLGTHLMNDETVVFALSQKDTARGRAAYWACGLGILVCWPIGAAIGGLAGTVIEDTDAFGLDAMFPAILLALILPALRGDREKRRAALAGAALALATTPFLPAGLPVLLALAGLALTAVGEKAPRKAPR
ncbi:AzlC family ABC transporter permease [Streptomyces purpurogeneiscleroticus]|uniref:AzlC family ABC transporter permease n=1 Tax=Streptomyces purpurogeneiscleroticus TaxID=68259 RepID=UPI001CBE34A8|nr:AzlC family ABC transporter permease [Streptomyces purpurogeneiscleroticus]MBZ4019511.1 branched-chain amino acid permease [Streptomyces purpurogeneiscleroticus]